MGLLVLNSYKLKLNSDFQWFGCVKKWIGWNMLALFSHFSPFVYSTLCYPVSHGSSVDANCYVV